MHKHGNYIISFYLISSEGINNNNYRLAMIQNTITMHSIQLLLMLIFFISIAIHVCHLICLNIHFPRFFLSLSFSFVVAGK